MSWKSTIYITREEALDLMSKRTLNPTNEELSDILEGCGYGDEINLPHYGKNFIILDELEEENKKWNKIHKL